MVCHRLIFFIIGIISASVYCIELQNNRTKYFICNLRKIDNRNKWKNYFIVTRVKLSVELDVLQLTDT